MIIKEIEPVQTPQKESKNNEPNRLNVVIFNDEITTQEFVVMLLMQIFGFNLNKAIELMLEIHISGAGVAGTYAFDIALFKRNQAIKMARKAQYPLKIECESVE